MKSAARLAVLSGLTIVAGTAVADPIPLDTWFAGPRIEDVSLSPDARYVAMIVRDGEHSYVAVKDRTTRDPAKPIIATDPTQDVEPQNCGWSSPARLVCRMSGRTGLHGIGEYVTRLIAIDVDGGNRRPLLNEPSYSMVRNDQYNVSLLADYLRITDWRAGEPDVMLVKGYFPGTQGYAVGRLNSSTGILRIVAKPSDPISAFVDDGAGHVLFGGGVPPTLSHDKQVQYFARASNDDDWKQLKKLVPYANNPSIYFGYANSADKTAHALFNYKGHLALYRVDLTDQRDPELIYWHESRDVSRTIYDDDAHLLGVAFASNLLGPQYLDPKMAALDTALHKQWPNRLNWVEGGSADSKVYHIRTSSLSEPDGRYILDTSGAGVRFDLLGYGYPGFAKLQLPTTIPALIHGRGGHDVEALFTPSADAGKKAPLVVFADGTQQVGGFEPATYFLASRGYAVIRPYFTGSRVDANSIHASFLDWNGTLYDDIIDAVNWATGRPDVDASRICIVGRNGYGGFTALLAAARADSPFKCAASLGGFSDLDKMRKDSLRHDTIEDERPKGTRDEQVEKEAPLKRAASFHMPVLLVDDDVATHTSRDARGAREMAEALAAASKPHQLLLIKDVDEAYIRIEYAELEKFLATNLR